MPLVLEIFIGNSKESVRNIRTATSVQKIAVHYAEEELLRIPNNTISFP
jgi:hypothetical protein